jgi:hypothetical protein
VGGELALGQRGRVAHQSSAPHDAVERRGLTGEGPEERQRLELELSVSSA